MNKRTLWVVISIAVVTVGAFAIYNIFSGTKKHLALIPLKSTFVSRVDVKSLYDKLDFKGEFKNTKFFKEVMSKMDNGRSSSFGKIFAKLLKDPRKIGLDIFSDVYIFRYSYEGEEYNAVVAAMDDSEDFKKTVAMFPGSKNSIKTTQQFVYLKENEDNVLAWNNTGMIYLQRENNYWNFWGSEEKKAPIETIVKGFLTMDEAVSIMQDENFVEYDKDENDVYFYINYETYLKSTIGKVSEEDKYKKILKMYQGVSLGVNLNFENERIALRSNFVGNKENINKLSFVKNNGLSDQSLECISSDKVLMLMTANIDVPKLSNFINEFISAMDYNGSRSNTIKRNTIESSLDEIGRPVNVSGKELISSLEGELAIAITDIGFIEKVKYDYVEDPLTNRYEMVPAGNQKIPFPTFTASLSFKNQSVLKKLMGLFPYLDSTSTYKGIKFPMEGNEINFYAVNTKDKLFLSNSKTNCDAMQSKGQLSNKISKDVVSLVKDHGTSMYVDLNVDHYGNLETFANEEMGEKGVNYFKAYMKMFKDITMSSDKNNGELFINLNKGKGNSLLRIFKQMDVLPFE